MSFLSMTSLYYVMKYKTTINGFCPVSYVYKERINKPKSVIDWTKF